MNKFVTKLRRSSVYYKYGKGGYRYCMALQPIVDGMTRCDREYKETETETETCIGCPFLLEDNRIVEVSEWI